MTTDDDRARIQKWVDLHTALYQRAPQGWDDIEQFVGDYNHAYCKQKDREMRQVSTKQP